MNSTDLMKKYSVLKSYLFIKVYSYLPLQISVLLYIAGIFLS